MEIVSIPVLQKRAQSRFNNRLGLFLFGKKKGGAHAFFNALRAGGGLRVQVAAGNYFN